MGVTCEKLELRRGGFHLFADWSLPKGASLALIGPSGAGKSLFLGGLAGFDDCASGSIEIEGRDMGGLPPAERPLTLMFQDHNLFPHLSVFQNVGLGISPGLKLSGTDETRIYEALDAVSLKGLDSRYPAELSGGQQSRAALARALIRRRPLLLLDEPFAALGPRLRRDMLDLVLKIKARHEMTLIYVTHSPEDARLADFTSIVAQHSVSSPKPTKALFDSPPEILRDYL